MSATRYFRVSGDSLSEVKPTGISESELDLERRIKSSPSFLGEDLVIIAEQLDFPEIKGDAVDLVGLASDGAVVIVELKKGKTPSGVDFQAIKYASYISHLDSDDLGKVAAEFLARQENGSIRERIEALGVEISGDQVDLAQLLAAWFKRDASEYDNSINTGQRIIVVAEAFDARIALAIEWLSRQGVRVSGVQYQQVEVDGNRLLASRRVFPAASVGRQFVASTKSGAAPEPWKVDGRGWHMKRLNPDVGEALDVLVDALGDHITEANWGQAYYVWLRGRARNLRIQTYVRSALKLGLHRASEEEAREFLESYADLALVPKVEGGYTNSPFVRPELGPDLPSDRLLEMLAHWLDGEAPQTAATTQDAATTPET